MTSAVTMAWPSTSVGTPTAISFTLQWKPPFRAGRFRKEHFQRRVEPRRACRAARRSAAAVRAAPGIARRAGRTAGRRNDRRADATARCRRSLLRSMLARLQRRPAPTRRNRPASVAFAVSSMKQVLKRPPEPNASPQPTMVSRMRQAFALGRADTRACQRVTLASVVRHVELRRLHEIDRDHAR